MASLQALRQSVGLPTGFDTRDVGLPGLSDAELAGDSERYRAWQELAVHERYSWALEAVRAAALEAGMHPDEVGGATWAQCGLNALAQRRGWSARTCVLYAKVARYAGLAVPRVNLPDPSPAPPPFPLLLTVGEASISDPDTVRALAWLSVAHRWPAPAPMWVGLRREQVTVSGAAAWVHLPGRDPVRAPGAGAAWARWERVRATLAGTGDSPWALCTLRAGPRTAVGAALSARTLQAAFHRHVAHVAAVAATRGHEHAAQQLHGLSYDSLRRHIMGSDPAALSAVAGMRGSTRASRRGASAAAWVGGLPSQQE